MKKWKIKVERFEIFLSNNSLKILNKFAIHINNKIH